MSRRVGPVPLTCPLRALGQFARPAAVVGIWLPAPVQCRRMVLAGQPHPGGCHAGAFLLSADLRHLLSSSHHVLAWDGIRLRRLLGGAQPAGRSARSAVAPYG